MSEQETYTLSDTLVIASSNAHKIGEVQEIMRTCAAQLLQEMSADSQGIDHARAMRSLSVRPLRDFGDAPEPVEDGATFEENACIKARAAHRFLIAQGVHVPVLADDSGLEVDALQGSPGVLSARYAGVHGDDAANNRKVLDELIKVSALEAHQRRARFVCALCHIDADGYEVVVRGTVEGYINKEAQGTQGFGYDPLFVSDAYAPRTLGQVSSDLKHHISHRGNALRRLVHQLCAR